jgi:hypothetical protein
MAMKALFKDILALAQVQGVVFFSPEGKVLFKEFVAALPEEPEARDWWGLFFHSLKGIREAEVVYEKARLYIRRSEAGFLMVLTGREIRVAMLRLHCDILLPRLKEATTPKGISRFFRRGISSGGK